MTASAPATAPAAVPASRAISAPPSPWTLLRDRGALGAGVALLLLAAAAWAGVALHAAQMSEMGMSMLPAAPGSVGDATLFTVMWGVMMAAMMLPSALPMLALYTLVIRPTPLAPTPPRAVPTALFAGTYLAVWLLLGVPVYLAGTLLAGLERTVPPAAAWLPYGLAAALVLAGAYQFSAIKRVCLTRCQNPLTFLMERWRPGYRATLRLGLAHATYCVGCCWGLMAILVAAGAMSLPWVLLIAAVVWAEKGLPTALGTWTARIVGVLLIALGVAVAFDPGLAIALRGQPAGPAMPAMPM